jgi:hypothetical protein
MGHIKLRKSVLTANLSSWWLKIPKEKKKRLAPTGIEQEAMA